MGIFDFVKKAGSKLFKKEPEADEGTYKPLRQHVSEHGIKADDLHFRFEQGVLIVEGWVPDQDTREKVILIVGNVEGIGQVDDRLNIGRAPAGQVAGASGGKVPLAGTVGQPGSGGGGGAGEWSSRTYTVKSGDTLSAIAKAHYGNANKYPLIFEANKPMLKDPDKIYPGQVLRIPNA